jgi:hypothetical protein
MHMKRFLILTAAVVIPAVVAVPASAQLSLQWMVPAVAHTAGVNGTFWRSDVSLHNPHSFDLPVVLQFLPSDTDNRVADTLRLTLYPWETFNLWDALGPDVLGADGSGALLVFADWELPCDPIRDCDFLVSSRTYTIDPLTDAGEFGQTIPGAATWLGVDWNTLGYAAGILNDQMSFRTNIGIASWGDDWTTVVVDVQDADGVILESLIFDLPPFGHVQERLETVVMGGSLVFWIEDGPADPLVFGYASVVDQSTGDPSFQLALPSPVGFEESQRLSGVQRRRVVPESRPRPESGLVLRSRSREMVTD